MANEMPVWTCVHALKPGEMREVTIKSTDWECPFCKDERKDRELKAMLDNLTSVQKRCTELLVSVHAGTSFIFGRDSDTDPRDAVLVARQYFGSKVDPISGRPYANAHDWAVFIHSTKLGLCVRGGMSTDEGKALAEKSRQFDTQMEALAYGQALLKEIRDGQAG
jgi:hypothetical protein